MKDQIAELQKFIQLQITSTTPMSDYHQGMVNGMIFALCLLTGEEPDYV